MIHNNNTMTNGTNRPNRTSHIARAGVVTPALALAILAGAAMAQSSGGGNAYEVIVESDQAQAEEQAREQARREAVQEVRTVVEINRLVDGKTLTIRRVNDEPLIVKLDGKQLSKDHFKMSDGRVVVTMPGSDRRVEIAMPQTVTDARSILGLVAPVEPAPPAPAGQIRLRGNTGGPAQAGEVAPRVDAQPKVMLGVVMAEPDPVILEHLGLDAKKAVMLERVVDGLPAEKAGLQAKDIIIGFGEEAEPRSADDIRKILAKAEPGSVVKVKVIRKGHPVTVDLKLEAFDAEALGRVAVTGGGAGQMRNTPRAAGQWRAFETERNQQHSHMERAEKAMREAAEMLARMERDLDHKAGDAHKQASKAVQQAIEAMKQGEAFGLEVEDMRRMQQEAVERLRGDMGDNQERRFWAQPDGEGGFALTFPGEEREDQWQDRLNELEGRLDRLEHTFDRAIDRMEERTEAMIERLMNRLERALDDREGRGGR